MPEPNLDTRFAEMANDADYQADAIALAVEFQSSDWEAFRCAEVPELTMRPLPRCYNQKLPSWPRSV